jgi:hypothetical protein
MALKIEKIQKVHKKTKALNTIESFYKKNRKILTVNGSFPKFLS